MVRALHRFGDGRLNIKLSKTAVYVANTSWYLYNFRLPLLLYMKQSGWRVITAAPRDRFSDELVSAGLEYVDLPINRRGLNPGVDAALLLRLYRLYRKRKPAIVHHFTIKPVLYGAIAARFALVPAIVSAVTGLGFVFITRKWWSPVLRGAVRLAYYFALGGTRGRTVFQNTDDRDAFIKEGLLSTAHARLIRGSGVNVSQFKPEPEPATPPVVVLFCSRMLWDKGLRELVDAARILRKKMLPIHFITAGAVDPGNPASVDEATLRSWRDEGLMEWIGHADDVAALLRRCHIAVLPSYREGLPKSLLEAAAAGKPLIATDVPGCRDVVRDGENGLLVPRGDVTRLAEAVERLASDGPLRARMGSRSREFALEWFSEEQIVSETIGVYRELLPELRFP